MSTTPSESPRPALGELARLATAVIEAKADVDAIPATLWHTEAFKVAADKLDHAERRFVWFAPAVVLQLVALATGGAEPEQQQLGDKTEKNQQLEPELQHESLTATSEGIAMTSTAALPPSAEFTQSFDARDWAAAFVQHVRANPSLPTDEGALIGWFANALMRGYDEHARSLTPERPADAS